MKPKSTDNQETGGRSFATAVLVALIPVFAWLYWVFNWAPGPHDVIALDHALVAREIVEGRGLNSGVVTPLHLRLEQDLEKAGPIFARPALSLWEALWFRFTEEPDDETLTLAAGVFFIPAAWLVYLLAARFHSRTTAWICFLVFVFNPRVLDTCTSGRPEAMGMFLISLLFLLVSHAPRTYEDEAVPPLRRSLGSGLAAGLLIQCMPHLAIPLLILLPLAWFRWRLPGADSESPPVVRTGRMPYLGAGARYLLGALIPALIVQAGRWFVDGQPAQPVGWYLVTVKTSVALGWSYWREFSVVQPDIVGFIAQFTPSLILKWLAGLSYGFTAAFDVFQPVVAALSVLALFFPEYGESHGFRWPLLFSVAIHVAGMALFYWDGEMLSIWTPVIIVTGIGTFADFLHQRRERLRETPVLEGQPATSGRLDRELRLYFLPVALLLVFTAGSLFLRVTEPEVAPGLATSDALERMKEHPERYAVVVTPAPWMVAWRTGARTLWMPETEYHLAQIETRYGDRLQSVFLPRNRADILHDELPIWWYMALRQRDRLPSYQLADFSGYGEAVYLRKTQDAETVTP